MKTAKDTTGIEEEDDTETLEKLKNSKPEFENFIDTLPVKKEKNETRQKVNAILPEKQRKPDTNNINK